MNINTIQADLQKMIGSDFPVQVEISNISYSGTFTNQKIEKVYSKYGVDNSYNCSVIISKNELTNIPEVKSKIRADEVEYRILDIELNHASVVLDLEKVRT